MRFISGFGRFWFDFIVGDDWRIALGVVLVLGLGAVLVATDALHANVLMPLLARDRRARQREHRGGRAALTGAAPRSPQRA